MAGRSAPGLGANIYYSDCIDDSGNINTTFVDKIFNPTGLTPGTQGLGYTSARVLFSIRKDGKIGRNATDGKGGTTDPHPYYNIDKVVNYLIQKNIKVTLCAVFDWELAAIQSYGPDVKKMIDNTTTLWTSLHKQLQRFDSDSKLRYELWNEPSQFGLNKPTKPYNSKLYAKTMIDIVNQAKIPSKKVLIDGMDYAADVKTAHTAIANHSKAIASNKKAVASTANPKDFSYSIHNYVFWNKAFWDKTKTTQKDQYNSFKKQISDIFAKTDISFEKRHLTEWGIATSWRDWEKMRMQPITAKWASGIVKKIIEASKKPTKNKTTEYKISKQEIDTKIDALNETKEHKEAIKNNYSSFLTGYDLKYDKLDQHEYYTKNQYYYDSPPPSTASAKVKADWAKAAAPAKNKIDFALHYPYYVGKLVHDNVIHEADAFFVSGKSHYWGSSVLDMEFPVNLTADYMDGQSGNLFNQTLHTPVLDL